MEASVFVVARGTGADRGRWQLHQFLLRIPQPPTYPPMSCGPYLDQPRILQLRGTAAEPVASSGGKADQAGGSLW